MKTGEREKIKWNHLSREFCYVKGQSIRKKEKIEKKRVKQEKRKKITNKPKITGKQTTYVAEQQQKNQQYQDYGGPPISHKLKAPKWTCFLELKSCKTLSFINKRYNSCLKIVCIYCC